jgi:arginyl-tRNA synthetase
VPTIFKTFKEIFLKVFIFLKRLKKMEQKLKNIIKNAFISAFPDKAAELSNIDALVEIEEPKFEIHGDFSSNIAMKTASICRTAPLKIAESVKNNIKNDDNLIEKIEIVKPGFINFFINPTKWHSLLKNIYNEKEKFGSSDFGSDKKVQIEFVSANPTGPLHIGHGRGAAVGDSLSRVFLFCGFDVEKEYYINDSGRQINTLGLSVFLRYKELFGEKTTFPDDCYQGEYIIDIAKELKDKKGKELIEIDEKEAVSFCAKYSADKILNEIKEDLKDFKIDFDVWFSEKSLYNTKKVEAALNHFIEKKIVYKKDGAFWFKTSDFGDEKDRVVVRQNGDTTYFASDMAYHHNKFERGFEKVIDIWGADHHGYIPRMKAFIKASDLKDSSFDVILIQLVNLLRDGKPASMSTRGGEFVTLRQLIDEVGADAARFIFLNRHYESQLDFDIELAKKKSNDNPVYYVQYVHARIAGIVEKAKEKGIKINKLWNDHIKLQLKEPEDVALIKNLSHFPKVVENSAKLLEPHKIAFYLMELAGSFHAYYNKHRILTDDLALTNARIYLAGAVKIVIKTGLNLLGVSAPNRM